MFLRFTSKQTITEFFCSCIFCLPYTTVEDVFFQSEIWIAQNFNLTVFEDFFYRCHGNIDSHKM